MAMGYQVVACADAQIASSAFRSRSTIDMLRSSVRTAAISAEPVLTFTRMNRLAKPK